MAELEVQMRSLQLELQQDDGLKAKAKRIIWHAVGVIGLFSIAGIIIMAYFITN
jgi:hypothetical protein